VNVGNAAVWDGLILIISIMLEDTLLQTCSAVPTAAKVEAKPRLVGTAVEIGEGTAAVAGRTVVVDEVERCLEWARHR